MELQKGRCFICRNANVIKSSHSQKAYKLITLLLPEEVLDAAEFDRVRSNLKICPICYHKLIIMKRASKHLQKDIPKEVSTKNCLCNSEKNLFQINKWPKFSAISEGTDFAKRKISVICSDCFFYLVTLKELKSKLFGRYPYLKILTPNENKSKGQWKLRFTPKIKLRSTPLSEKIKRNRVLRRTMPGETVVVPSSDDELVTKANINLKSLEKFKPLKDHKSFKNHKIVKTDSKFFNQIPYVLVNLYNKNVDTFPTSTELKCTDKGENKNIKIQNENNVSVKSGVNLRTKIDNNANEKHLTVQVSRADINKYLTKSESNIENTNAQNSSNRAEESTSDNDTNSFTKIHENSEIDTSFETQNKRKSVSFADDKNVEIQYSENELKRKSRNYNSDEDSEPISKRRSKGILKREDEQTPDASENPSKESSNDTKVLNKSGSKDVEQNSQNQEDEKVEASTTQILNRRNSYLIDESNISDISDSNSDIEILTEIIKKSIVENNDFSDDDIVLVDENTMDKEKERAAKPVEFITIEDDDPDGPSRKEESDEKTKTSIDDDSELASEDKELQNCDKNSESPLSEGKKSNSDEPEDVDKDNSVGQLDINKDTQPGTDSVKPKSYKPKPLSKKKLNDESEDVDKDNSAGQSENDKDTESGTDSMTPKRYKPKPLSKKKLDDESEDVDKDNSAGQLDVDKDTESGTESVKSKRHKPKPLSKKKLDDESEDVDKDNSARQLDVDKDTDSGTDSVNSKRHKPKPLSKKKLNDESEDVDKDNSAAQLDVAKDTESGTDSVKSKRHKPKPLSKRKLNAESEDVDKDNSAGQLDVDKDTESGTDSVKSKRHKPKPLSQKKLDENCQTTDDISNKIDENPIDSEKEESTAHNRSHTASELDTRGQFENDDLVEDTSEGGKENGTLNAQEIPVEKEEQNLEDKSAEETPNVSEFSEELEGNGTKDTIDKDSESSIDGNKSDSISGRDVMQLVNKYLNDQEEDGNRSSNAQREDAEEVTLNSTKDSEENTTAEDDKVSKPFDDIEKNEELGISAVDNDNITSILSHMFPSELPDDGSFDPKSPSTNEVESGEDMGLDLKRKMVDDELNTSKERKKKRVTFYDDVT